MRAWARSNGYDVADRGRLPAEVTEAYLAAHPGGSGRTATATKSKPAAAKKSAGRKQAAKKAAAKKAAPTPEKSSSSSESAAPAKQPAAPQAAPAAKPTGKPDPAPKPSVVSDDRRLVALGEQIAALTKRVEALESAGGTKSSSKNGAKSSRFRRSR